MCCRLSVGYYITQAHNAQINHFSCQIWKNTVEINIDIKTEKFEESKYMISYLTFTAHESKYCSKCESYNILNWLNILLVR